MKSDDIVQFIVNRRKQLGISQHDIAFKLGYTNQLVSNWENGKSIPDLVSIASLANILQITLEDFFNLVTSSSFKENKPFNVDDFSFNLKKLRTINSLTQAKLAIQLNVSYATVIAWEKGSSIPNINQFFKLKEIYNISFTDLYYGNFVFLKKKNKAKPLIISLSSGVALLATVTGVYFGIIRPKLNTNNGVDINQSSSLNQSVDSNSNSSSNSDSSTSSIINPIVVNYYDEDRHTLLWSGTFNQGETIVYGKSTPTKNEDDYYTYTFDSWISINASDVGKEEQDNYIYYAAYYNSTSKFANEDDFTISNKGVLNSYTSGATTVVIPSEINGVAVTSIGSTAFTGNTTISKIVIPSSVETIKQQAFRNCTSLKEVIFPVEIDSIGNEVFSGCTNLETLILPKYAKTIGIAMLQNTYLIKHIDIPKGVTNLPDYCFGECKGLETVSIPEGVISIGIGAFANTKIVSVDLPSTLTSIGDRAFDTAYSAHLDIPEGVTYLGEDIMRNNEGAYIVVPKSVKTWNLTSTLLSNNKVSIYYKGNKEEFNSINFINEFTPNLDLYTNIHFYSETPTTNGWHYVDEIPTLYE